MLRDCKDFAEYTNRVHMLNSMLISMLQCTLHSSRFVRHPSASVNIVTRHVPGTLGSDSAERFIRLLACIMSAHHMFAVQTFHRWCACVHVAKHAAASSAADRCEPSPRSLIGYREYTEGRLTQQGAMMPVEA